jgi:DNA-binding SARP family transcriptional activator
LLACAVFQHYSGNTKNALTTIQEVHDIAHKTELVTELLWSLWGGCAICVQSKEIKKAIEYLAALKHVLSDQNDWILEGFVDVLIQTLEKEEIGNKIVPKEFHERQSAGNVLAHTFQWLYQWGFSAQAQNIKSLKPDKSEQPQRRGLSRIRIESLRSLSLLFKGELNVNWLENNSQRRRQRSSFWGYILSLLHIEVTSKEQEDATEIIDSEIFPTESIVEVHPSEKIIPSSIQDTKPSHITAEDSLSISVQMLGTFNLTIHEMALNLSPSKSLSLLQYLLYNHKQKTPREMLIEQFWPDTPMEKGRNNLNVAMNGIRTSLRMITDTPVILYKDHTYGIAEDIQFWFDVEEFERLIDSGKRLETRNRMSSAISDYEAAVSLYQGDFLEESRYENWAILPRERLRWAYLTTLDRLSHIYYEQKRYAMCITFSQLILAHDRCREDAHSMLMRCYSRQGQDYLALRQYQACVDALRLELNVTPAPETTKLYEEIRQHNRV